MARLNELVKNQDDYVATVQGARLPSRTPSPPVSFKDIEASMEQASVDQQAQHILDADHWYAEAEWELPLILEAVRRTQPFSLDGVTRVAQGLIE